MIIVFSIWVGFVLDLLFGDPYDFPHPVRLIGWLISVGEKGLRRFGCKTARSQFVSGLILTLVTLLITGVAIGVLSWLGFKVGLFWGILVQVVFCWLAVAAKDLRTESMAVYAALKRKNLPKARERLARIVGRDTAQLDEEHVIRAAVETVAENTSDGVTVPLFYLFIGGATLGFLYKAVNTLDSMIGYRNERYQYFGRFAAKLDDVANFVPARLSGLLMVFSSFFVGQNVRGAWRIYKRDRLKHHSPNSAHTEAACAGALGIELAGDSSYFGKIVQKPTIGDATRPAEIEDIRRANRLLFATTFTFLVAGSIVRLLILWLIRLL